MKFTIAPPSLLMSLFLLVTVEAGPDTVRSTNELFVGNNWNDGSCLSSNSVRVSATSDGFFSGSATFYSDCTESGATLTRFSFDTGSPTIADGVDIDLRPNKATVSARFTVTVSTTECVGTENLFFPPFSLKYRCPFAPSTITSQEVVIDSIVTVPDPSQRKDEFGCTKGVATTVVTIGEAIPVVVPLGTETEYASICTRNKLEKVTYSIVSARWLADSGICFNSFNMNAFDTFSKTSGFKIEKSKSFSVDMTLFDCTITEGIIQTTDISLFFGTDDRAIYKAQTNGRTKTTVTASFTTNVRSKKCSYSEDFDFLGCEESIETERPVVINSILTKLPSEDSLSCSAASHITSVTIGKDTPIVIPFSLGLDPQSGESASADICRI